MTNCAAAPSANVLMKFGLADNPFRVSGGQGETFQSGDVILKPVLSPEEGEWSARVLCAIRCEGFRVAPPIQSIDGLFVVDGWAAHQFVEGSTCRGTQFEERFNASRSFHASLAGLACPSFFELRTHPWAVADRVTWGLDLWEPHRRVALVLESLRSLSVPIDLPWQVVHGDISGNILVHEGLPPAIIDFTPYWAPAGFGEAVFVVDAVLWEGADLLSLLRLGSTMAGFSQLLVRAATRRLLEVDCHHRMRGLPDSYLDEVDAYRGLADRLVDVVFR